jgi:colicin import membrane protein
MTYRRLFSRPAPRAALILATGLALGLAGCDRDDEASQAIDRANLNLQSLAPGGVNPPSAAYKNQVYGEIKSSLANVNGTKAENAAAALLTAQAQAGLAEAPAAEATDLERACLNDITEIRALLGRWLGLSASADAAAAYDPTKELADIDAEVKAREEDRVQQQQKKAGVDQRVADLLAQAKQKADAAKAKQQEAGRLRSQVANQTAVQGEQSLKQAQEIGRDGDALEVEAADLEAQAAQTAPQSGEIQLEIDKLSNQKDLLGQARADVLKRAENAKAQAASARADAAKVAEEIAKRVAALDERRAAAMKATDEATSGYKAAAASAKKAQSESRTAGQMAFGAAEQTMGDLEWARAQGLTAYASLMDSLASAKPALPKAADFKSKGDEARAAAKTALEAATEAYKLADAAYKAGGGQDKDRLDRINAKLAGAVKLTSGGAEDIRNPDAPKEEAPAETPSGTEAAAPAGDASTPQATVQALLDAQNGTGSTNIAGLFDASEQERQVLQGLFGTVAPKMQKMTEALKAKFGSEVEEMSSQMGAAAGMDVEKLKNLKAADLKFNIQGDTAEAPLPNGQTITLTKKDGKWLVDPASVGLQPAQMPMLKAMIPALSKALDGVTADIQAGKFKSAQEAMASMQTRMMGAAMQNMPKPPPGKK